MDKIIFFDTFVYDTHDDTRVFFIMASPLQTNLPVSNVTTSLYWKDWSNFSLKNVYRCLIIFCVEVDGVI